MMNGFIKLGTQKIQPNYQGINYLFEVTDYILQVTGNTYSHKEQLKASGYMWDSLDKYWWKSFNNVEELETAYNGWNDTLEGLTATVSSIYRQVKPV